MTNQNTAGQQRDNSGALFLNSRRKSDKAPDYVGTLMVNGHPMEICAWVRQGKYSEFLSIKVQESAPTSRHTQPQSGAQRPTPEQVAAAEAQRGRMMRGAGWG
ncbi:hypothetical protein AAC691_13000 [Nguyenibacter vanlangensis]|uniref:Uncharacterized protein n=1 Tax=Nguyenibacter vanlangensis TaxID=1216886 RepID=A0ABZ3D0E6_9PROT